jgi:hypothetical protein
MKKTVFLFIPAFSLSFYPGFFNSDMPPILDPDSLFIENKLADFRFYPMADKL